MLNLRIKLRDFLQVSAMKHTGRVRKSKNCKTNYRFRELTKFKKSSFTPFVISTTGGMAPEADAFLKRLSQKLSTKLDQSYSNTVGYLRRKLRIELLKTVLMAVRGYRKSKTVNISDLDLNLLSYYVK